MHHRYPPDVDASDVFGLTEDEIDAILDMADNCFSEDRDEAISYVSEEYGMSESRAEDLLEWFGR